MTFTTLLGDSIIDNKSYVQHGEFSVLEHLEHQSDLEFQQLASVSGYFSGYIKL